MKYLFISIAYLGGAGVFVVGISLKVLNKTLRLIFAPYPTGILSKFNIFNLMFRTYGLVGFVAYAASVITNAVRLFNFYLTIRKLE